MTWDPTGGPPREVSASVLSAIQGALREEKQPRAIRLIKVFTAATAGTAILATPLLLAFREQLSIAWLLSLGAWWLALLVGFYLYYYPQPRLTVSGYWSPWVFAKILIAMTVVTCLEILICPSFAFLESPLPWAPFERFTHFFMRVGGMPACMLFCGFLFAGLGGLLTFAVVARTLKGSSAREALRAAGLAYMIQWPVLGMQLWDAALRPFAGYWLIGGTAGVVLTVLAVKAVTNWRLSGNS